MRPILYILCGIPGSGKSTFANHFINNDNTIWVSRDAIRFSILSEDDDYFEHEKEVFECFISQISGLLQTNYNVIADATHLSEVSRKKLTNAIDRNFTNYDIVYVIFKVSNELCIAHNKLRDGRAVVPDDVMHRMGACFTIPKKNEDVREKGRIIIEGEIM